MKKQGRKEVHVPHRKNVVKKSGGKEFLWLTKTHILGIISDTSGDLMWDLEKVSVW